MRGGGPTGRGTGGGCEMRQGPGQATGQTGPGQAMNHIEQLAQRLADDPFFLAAALHRFAASAGLDDSALAVRLRCAPEVLTLLRLCRMPRSESPAFGRDVDTIAARFGLDGD